MCMPRGSAFASSDTLGSGGLTWVVVLRSDPHSVPGRGRAAAQPCGREGVRVRAYVDDIRIDAILPQGAAEAVETVRDLIVDQLHRLRV